MSSRLADDRLHLPLMLALTFATGIADAVGYLALDRVFTGNMTGNVVILAMALAGGNGLPVAGPALALAGFMVGAAFAGRVQRGAGAAWSGRTTFLLALVAVVLGGLGVLLLVVGREDHDVQVLVTTLTATAMGIQAAAARQVAVKDVTTVVVTSTITGLAADSVLGSGRGEGTGRRSAAVLAIMAGALVGALLVRWEVGPGLLLGAVVVLAVTVTGEVGRRT